MDIQLKYRVLDDNFNFIFKENRRMRNLLNNQHRQIENLKKRLEGKLNMNNEEALEDFLEFLRKEYPLWSIDEKNEMLIGMAINYAFLVINNKEEMSV